MNIIIPIAGIGKRFTDSGYKEPKPLIKILNKELLRHILDNLNFLVDDKIFIIYHTYLDTFNFSSIIKSNYDNVYLIPISFRTDGSAETVLYGINHILDNKLSNLEKCVILDCDTIYNTNILKKIRNNNTNGVISFKDDNTNIIYSYVKLNNNNKIIDIKEKDKISEYANTGAYFFKDILKLKKYCNIIIEQNIKFKNEYYISCVIKKMLEDDEEFQSIIIDKKYYKSIGTPEELDSYLNNHISFLFDLDGTLVKTENIYFKIWTDILADFNITLTDTIFNNYIDGNNDLYAMERLQIDKSSYNITEISGKKDELFSKYTNEIAIIEGSKSFIKELKKLGHSISIVSNCNRKTCESIIKYMGIYNYIDHIIIGNECKNPKPYPDPYLKAIELLGTVNTKCIIFEDSKSGLLSALSVNPKNIIGIDNGKNSTILQELNINTIINNYNNITLTDLINNKINEEEIIIQMINNSLSKKYDIKNIKINTNKLKGGYISDVIKVNIELKSGEIIDSVLKYENKYTSSLTKMAYKLGLFDREYYFYENISSYININTPKYIGTIKDLNFVSKGILLENIDKEGFYLNLNLNKEKIDVSLKVIEESARFHSQFWGKDLENSFKGIKKHNNKMFNPVWGNFIREKWPIFYDRWKH
jgi:HAD superfamily hydrolase (TIGR01509 family)